MTRIEEAFRDYKPPHWVRPTVERLLAGLPPAYLSGLQAVILTNAHAVGAGRTRRIAGRKYDRRSCRGFYHRRYAGNAASIEIIVDNTIADTPAILRRVGLFRDFALAHVLFHEVGHHLDATIGTDGCVPSHVLPPPFFVRCVAVVHGRPCESAHIAASRSGRQSTLDSRFQPTDGRVEQAVSRWNSPRVLLSGHQRGEASNRRDDEPREWSADVAMREVLLAALVDRFAGQRPRTGPATGPVAVFPAKDPAIGEVTVRDAGMAGSFSVTVEIGDIIASNFESYDSHLKPREREERLTQEVVRFLEELFADRLLFWRSADGRITGWRERGDAGYSEPLVLDNRVYHRYLWSGPLPPWQAIAAILARGRIRDEREYQIVATLLEESTPGLEATELHRARHLASEYRRTSSEPL